MALTTSIALKGSFACDLPHPHSSSLTLVTMGSKIGRPPGSGTFAWLQTALDSLVNHINPTLPHSSSLTLVTMGSKIRRPPDLGQFISRKTLGSNIDRLFTCPRRVCWKG